MANAQTGYQPRNTPAERRAFFELSRQLKDLEAKVGGGGGGGAGVGSSYVHNQAVASSTWTVTHGLNYFPNVTIVDSANDEVVGDVHYDSATVLTIHFSASFAGKAYLS